MKRKSIKLVTTTLLLSTMLSFSAFADWEQADGAWKYKDDTTNVYVASQWIESTAEQGLWYYIDQTGVMAVNTTTPDGYYVNELGEWRESGGGLGGGATENNTDFDYSLGGIFEDTKKPSNVGTSTSGNQASFQGQ